jgi:AraC-like DNA-binding protein
LGNRINCSQAHLYGSYHAERVRGTYVFYCPIGLIHWASSVIIDDISVASVIGGPVQYDDAEELILEFFEKSGNKHISIGEVRKALRSVPKVSPTDVDDYVNLMNAVIKSVTGGDTSTTENCGISVATGPKISDYIYYVKTMGGNDHDSHIHYPLEKEKELIAFITKGDKKAARRTLNEILGQVFFSEGNNFLFVKARVLELVVLLSRAALEGGADAEEIFGLNYTYLDKINSFTTIEQLATWLARIMNRFSDLVFNLTDVKHVDVMFKALGFIKKNYMNKISLHDVAEAANISPSYFSKVFKEEMKCNFNVYLNKYRVEVAKKLLLDLSIPLVNVALFTGFEDQSYFSKVFKKVTGLTPGKYRESMGRFCEEKTG